MSATIHPPQAVPAVTSSTPGHPDEFVGRPITPAEQLRILLARRKLQGIGDWDRVWAWAVARVRWPHDHDERHGWRSVVVWAEPSFRAAYEDTPGIVDMGALVRIIDELVL